MACIVTSPLCVRGASTKPLTTISSLKYTSWERECHRSVLSTLSKRYQDGSPQQTQKARRSSVVAVIQLAPLGSCGAQCNTLAFLPALLTGSPKRLHKAGAFARSHLLIEQPSGEDINVILLSHSVSHSWHLNMESKCKMSGKFLH